MTSRLITGLATAALSGALVMGGAMPASAGPGDWEEHDRVGGLEAPLAVAVLEGDPTLLFVTEPGANAISVLNADTLDLINREVFAGMFPVLIDVNPETGVVYFVDSGTWSVVRWDPSVTPTVTTQISVGDQIPALEVVIASDDPTQSRVRWTVAYSSPSSGELHSAPLDLSSSDVVDLGTNVFPGGLATLRFVDESVSPPAVFEEVLITDTYGDQVIAASGGIPLPTGAGPGGIALAVGPTALKLATANYHGDTVTVFDGFSTGTSTVAVPAGPFSVDFAGPAGPLFVASQDGNVSVIPAPFTGVEWTVPVGGFPGYGAYSTTLNRYFVVTSTPSDGEVVSIALTPAAADDEGGLAATGAADTAPAVAVALGAVLLGAALAGVFRRRRRAEA